MSKVKIDREDTVFLRFIAIVLILNSHLDLYYPIAHVGTGGAVGNALFFMMSSFGLTLSQKDRPVSLFRYFERRVLRIFPSVWVVLVVVLLPVLIYTSQMAQIDLLSFLGYFFYPPFWFIQALMCFYFAGYFIVREYNDRKGMLSGIILLVIYGFLYFIRIDLTTFSVESQPIVQIFYMGIFVFGVFLASRNDRIRYSGVSDILAALLILTTVYGHKLLMMRGLYLEFQFIQQFLLFPLAFYLLKLSRSPFVISKLMAITVLSHAIRWIGESSLEIYLVHTVLARLLIHRMYNFPVNLLVFLLSTFIIVFVVNSLSASLRRLADREASYGVLR
jgi:peptidoglycan/LPS O-acetylase OafA/YrhL